MIYPFPKIESLVIKYGNTQFRFVDQVDAFLSTINSETIADIDCLIEIIVKNYDYRTISRWIDSGLNAGYDEHQNKTLMCLFLVRRFIQLGMSSIISKVDYSRHGYINPHINVRMSTYLHGYDSKVIMILEHHCENLFYHDYDNIINYLNSNDKKKYFFAMRYLIDNAKQVEETLMKKRASKENKILSSAYCHAALLHEAGYLSKN